LWSLYQRTPKRDTIKVEEQRKVTVKKKGKTRTVIEKSTKLVLVSVKGETRAERSVSSASL